MKDSEWKPSTKTGLKRCSVKLKRVKATISAASPVDVSTNRSFDESGDKFSSFFEVIPTNLSDVNSQYLKSFLLYLGSFLETVQSIIINILQRSLNY